MMTAKTASLSPETRRALIGLLYRLADDALIVGHRNSEWTGLGPILEADIAFSSMAQDKMGHAQAYYQLLHELGEADPDTLAFARKPDQFRCCWLAELEKGDWARSLMRQFFFSEADALRASALSLSSYPPLAALARKFRGEIKYHVMHGRMWIEKLGQATSESRQRLQTAVDDLFSHALGMFETPADEAILVRETIGPAESELAEKWLEEVEPVLSTHGLSVPQNVQPVFGGRVGRHDPALATLLESMQKVYRLDPTAKW